MDNIPLGRAYLESLSTSDLVQLADTHGIDIPEGLNRRFIIGELLELAEENLQAASDPALLTDADFAVIPDVLPETYNETQITLLMRDPGWIFVFWDFHSTVFSSVTGHHRFESFFLRVNSISTGVEPKVTDYFDIDVGIHDRKWYIHHSDRQQACRVDLYSRNTQEKEQLLAKSSELLVPPGGAGELNGNPRRRIPPLLELSGISELRKQHYRNHRQAFS